MRVEQAVRRLASLIAFSAAMAGAARRSGDGPPDPRGEDRVDRVAGRSPFAARRLP
jgi:hypothetical protein